MLSGKVYSKVVHFTDWANFFGEVFNDIGWEEVKDVKEPPIKKEKVMKRIIAKSPPISFIRERLLMAGTKIGSVWFIKGDGSLRKMTYRLKVTKPTYASVPKEQQGYQVRANGSAKVLTFNKHKTIAENNNLMTVFDTNKVIYDKEGNKVGRGAWRSIPLLSVKRICSNGEIVEIE